MLVVTPTIVDRLVRVEAENLRARLRHYVDGDANPCGVFMRSFGDATAFIALDIPTRFFNSVLAVSVETRAHLGHALAQLADRRLDVAVRAVVRAAVDHQGDTEGLTSERLRNNIIGCDEARVAVMGANDAGRDIDGDRARLPGTQLRLGELHFIGTR